MKLSDQQLADFQAALWSHYDRQARHELPWRKAATDGSFDPYEIWVSELMLQQTQVSRVVPKYLAFLAQFPTVQTLANAQLGEVLIAWQGLGYNRRAKYLWQAAQIITNEQQGRFPDTFDALVALPGIGRNTAGAILAYAFNQPVSFVETNVRTVYFHHFFSGQHEVSDRDIQAILEQTLDQDNPREFYWALMDYGSYLKRQGKNNIAQSKHYNKQSKFEGSLRQIRGRVLRELSSGPLPTVQLLQMLGDERGVIVVEQLASEGLIVVDNNIYRLA